MTLKFKHRKREMTLATFGVGLLAIGAAAVAANEDGPLDQKCIATQLMCKEHDEGCDRFRKLINKDRIYCPGINAPARPIANEDVAGNIASRDLSHLEPADRLARIQTGCDAANGYKTFSGQVKCIQAGIHESDVLSSAIISADLQLYTLTADNLVDEVARKSISTSGARVELQKAFLEFRDRAIRRDTELIARENEQANAARLRAQQAEAAATAAQERANDRRAAAQAADEARAREDQRRQDEAVEFCISEATQRIAANPRFRNDNTFTLGIYQVGNTYRNVDKFCASDRYWYKQVPEPQKFINCQNQGMLGVNCTQQ
jgi:hypothetical protein